MALVTPAGENTRTTRVAITRLTHTRCVRMSLARYSRDRAAPLSIVLCPTGAHVQEDVAFLENVRRKVAWPPPSAELWSAIAGLRGSHDPPPAGALPGRGRSRRGAALLLEGDVTLERARRAVASGAPRDWIVERVQRVRGTAEERKQLDRLGVRWSVLAPVEVRAVVVTPLLLRARNRWENWFPDAQLWTTDPSD